MSARQKFLDVFPALQTELLDYLRAENMPQEAVEWYEKSLAHNTPGGKLNRGLSVVDTLDILLCTDAEGKRTRDLSEQEYKDAAVLGWCVELLQAYFLVADDMMDASLTRRGQPCWYKMKGVGNIAINDAFMLEAAIYHLLKTHFRSKPYYGLLIELFHETTFQTELGQLVDLITAPEDDVDLNRFSLKKHSLIVIYKTAFYSFYLPVALAMRMAGITDESLYKRALDILLPLGEYFQVQDDYLDCYGSPEVIGKIGTDIQDNKCGWLINVALTKATAEQRSVLDAHYGQRSADSEAKVKEVFKQIDVEALFKTYEKESFERISAMIAELPQNVGAAQDGSGGLKREVFTSFLEKVYKRTK